MDIVYTDEHVDGVAEWRKVEAGGVEPHCDACPRQRARAAGLGAAVDEAAVDDAAVDDAAGVSGPSERARFVKESQAARAERVKEGDRVKARA